MPDVATIPAKTDTQKVTEARFIKAANVLWKALHDIQKGFILDEHNRSALQAVTNWMIDEPHGDLTRGKGILLTGPVGTGKTDLMNAVSRSLNVLRGAGFNVINVKRVEKEFNLSDDGSRDKTKVGGDHVIMRYASMPHVCFDDLALEEDGRHYGRSANIFADIIALRYEGWRKGERMTHFTTNATAEQLEKRYDQRTLTRLCEMCGELYLGGPMRRAVSAPPTRQYVMPPLFEVQETPAPIPQERLQEHFSRLREVEANTAKSMANRTLSVVSNPTKEEEQAAIVEHLPTMDTDKLETLRREVDGSPFNKTVVLAIDAELDRRDEA